MGKAVLAAASGTTLDRRSVVTLSIAGAAQPSRGSNSKTYHGHHILLHRSVSRRDVRL